MLICNVDTLAPKLGKQLSVNTFPDSKYKMRVHGKFKIMQNMSCLGVEKKLSPITTVKMPH